MKVHVFTVKFAPVQNRFMKTNFTWIMVKYYKFH